MLFIVSRLAPMSKASKSSAAVAAPAPPPQFRPSPIPVSALIEQANAHSLLPSLVHSTVNSLVHAAIERLYHAGIERAAEQYVAQQAVEDVLGVIEWLMTERDEGEEKWISGWEGMTAADEAQRQKHLWLPEDEPLPTTIDRWARHVLPVTAPPQKNSTRQSTWSEAEAAPAASSDDIRTLEELVPAPLHGTAPFSVVSASIASSTFTSPAAPTRSNVAHSTKPHRLPSPSSSVRPRPSSTSSVAAPQPASLCFSSSQPYPLPSSSPPAPSEQQRLARMATLRQQQADIADKKRREKERVAEEERRREEERAKERALMSARRQKSAALQSARLTASDSKPQPRKRHTQSNASHHEEKQQLPDASPASSSTTTTLPSVTASHRTSQPAKPKRGHKQAADDSTVDGYTNAAALMVSIVRSFVPAAGVRLVYGSEVKAGAEIGGGGGGEGRGRGVSVEDEQWVSVVRGMNRSQYMRWMDEQRAQAAKEADIQLRQHSTFAPASNTQQTQPTGQHQRQLLKAAESDEADHHSTTVQAATQGTAT